MTIITGGPIVNGAIATTYTELVQQVEDFLARDDLTDFIPLFIGMAEDWFNYGMEDIHPLRVREMEAYETLTPDEGECTIPDDFLQVISAVSGGSSRRALNFITQDAVEMYYPTRTGGIPCDFTIRGNSLFMYPVSEGDVDLFYYAKIPQLVTSESNWLLVKAPTLYFRATLAVAADFIKDGDEAAKNLAVTKGLMTGLNRSDMVGKYARTGLRMRGPCP